MTTRYPPLSATNILGQANVPLILQSSGSIANNGALTGLSSTGVAYPSCYMWFPTNTISAATPAGWYYVVMSSATAGTIYNNTYTTGTPTVPASPTAFATTGPGAYTQTTASLITAYQLVIPPNTLGINDSLRVRVDMLTISNVNATRLMTHLIGASAVRNIALAVSVLGDDDEFEVVNMGTQANQQVNPAAPTGVSVFGGINVTPVLFTLDFTVSQTYKVQMQLGTATDYVGISRVVVERIPGVA